MTAMRMEIATRAAWRFARAREGLFPVATRSPQPQGAPIRFMFFRLSMRVPALFLALLGAILLGGCTHPAGHRPPPPACESLPRPASHAPLHVYVDCALPTESSEHNRALSASLALTLRGQLRQHGFDVRGAESTLRDGNTPSAPGETISQLMALAQAIAMGSPAPTSSRAATYLHPNSPRLLLIVCLTPADKIASRRPEELILGGFLVDSATGVVRWSGRASAHTTGDDQGLRLLADKLGHSLSALPPR
jgi:hypothetical protein